MCVGSEDGDPNVRRLRYRGKKKKSKKKVQKIHKYEAWHQESKNGFMHQIWYLLFTQSNVTPPKSGPYKCTAEAQAELSSSLATVTGTNLKAENRF